MPAPIVAAAAVPALTGGGAAAAGAGGTAATATAGSSTALAANGGGGLKVSGDVAKNAFTSSAKPPSGPSPQKPGPDQEGPEAQGPSLSHSDPWTQMGMGLAASVGEGKSLFNDVKTKFGGQSLNHTAGFGGPSPVGQGGPMAMLNNMKPGGMG